MGWFARTSHKKKGRYLKWPMCIGVVLSSVLIRDVAAHPPLFLLKHQMLHLQSHLQQVKARCFNETRALQPLGIVSYNLQPVDNVVFPPTIQPAACRQIPGLTKKLETLSALYLMWQQPVSKPAFDPVAGK